MKSEPNRKRNKLLRYSEDPIRPEFSRTPQVVISAVFCSLLVYVYLTWLSDKFGYFGFTRNNDGFSKLWISFALVLISSAMLSPEIVLFSDFFLWVIFYFLYVPTMLFVPLQDLPHVDVITFILALTTSLHLMRTLARVPITRFNARFQRRDFIFMVVAAYCVLNIAFVLVFSENIRLVDFYSVYDQRKLASEAANGTLVGYASGMLSGALNPFLMALGLVERRKVLIFLGIAGQVLVYGALAFKSVLLSIIFLPVFHFWVFRRSTWPSANIGHLVLGSCAVPLLLLGGLSTVAEGWDWQIASIIFMRTYGTAGTITGIYAEFFSANPLTYYSHINLISFFLTYPYTRQLGFVIGEWGYGFTDLNANASFWATDGIAALGIVGIPFIGAIIGLFLAAVNSQLSNSSVRLACLASMPFILTVCNGSFFSSLLGGGGLLVFLLVILYSECRL